VLHNICSYFVIGGFPFREVIGNRKKPLIHFSNLSLKLKDKIKTNLFLLSGGFVEKGI
jgi:hypothetical protein